MATDLDEHVHLLADEQARRIPFHGIHDLQDAGVDAFAVVSRERLLGDDVGLHAHEPERI
jgi:hypothetical protein